MKKWEFIIHEEANIINSSGNESYVNTKIENSKNHYILSLLLGDSSVKT